MIKKIHVKGYQALYDVEVECAGFTVIYGESDVGKSAFYRAIRAFLTAESGDSFISYGQDVAEVSLDLDLGLGVTVTWKKKRGRSCDYVRKNTLGDADNWLRCKQLPDVIARELKINPILVDGEKFYPNLRGQFDSLFMLFESSSKRARLLGSLISNVLLKGVKEANLERYRNEADIRAFQELLVELEKKSKFNWEEYSGKVTACREILTRVKKAEEVLKSLSVLVQQRDELTKWTRLSPPDRRLAVWFEETDRMASLWAKITDILNTRIYVLMQLDGLEKQIEEIKRVLVITASERDETAKKLTIKCPHCQGDISLVEVQL